MTSLKTDDEPRKAHDQLIELLGKAEFTIRQWCSNSAKGCSVVRSNGKC